MSPKIGQQDEFEGLYTEKFRGLARPFGKFVKYERDRAALDAGIHLTTKTSRKFRSVSNTRVWFQLKGIQEATLSLADYEKLSDVSLDLPIDNLRFWYASPEAVYLVIYIESADQFLAEDIKDVIDRQWGEDIFSAASFKDGQQYARFRVSRKSILDDVLWQRMLSHRSMRIDGPSFRGRPLGHRLDPLRCIPEKLDPPVFDQLVNRLLAVHGYRESEKLDTSPLFPNCSSRGDVVSLAIGTLNQTYEWVWQMSTEFLFDEGSDFRIEGKPNCVHGPCAVLIHSHKQSNPKMETVTALATDLRSRGVNDLLVFANDFNDPGYFGSFFGAVRGTGVACMPQLLGELAFNILLASTVYLEFRDKISWRFKNYLY